MQRHSMLLALALGVTACGSAPREGGLPDRSVITAEEVASVRVSDAYELIARLRPEFLRSRGSFSVRNPQATRPLVYVDNVRYGGIAQLRNIAQSAIRRVEHLSASDATTRRGTGHTGGVVHVRTRR